MANDETQIVATTSTAPNGTTIPVFEVVVSDKGAFGNGKTGSAFEGGGLSTGTPGGGTAGGGE